MDEREEGIYVCVCACVCVCVCACVYIYLYTAFDYICLRDTCGLNVPNSLQTSVSLVREHKEVSMRD